MAPTLPHLTASSCVKESKQTPDQSKTHRAWEKWSFAATLEAQKDELAEVRRRVETKPVEPPGAESGTSTRDRLLAVCTCPSVRSKPVHAENPGGVWTRPCTGTGSGGRRLRRRARGQAPTPLGGAHLLPQR